MDDYDLIEASFLSQYGIRLRTTRLDFDEFLKIDLSMSDFAKKICHRNFGIGADGLIIPKIDEKNADNEDDEGECENTCSCYFLMTKIITYIIFIYKIIPFSSSM